MRDAIAFPVLFLSARKISTRGADREGIRPGEELHEEMITATDSLGTIDIGPYYAILPSVSFNGERSKEDYIAHYNAKPVPEGFHYSSDNNDRWETVESMREKIRKFVEPGLE